MNLSRNLMLKFKSSWKITQWTSDSSRFLMLISEISNLIIKRFSIWHERLSFLSLECEIIMNSWYLIFYFLTLSIKYHLFPSFSQNMTHSASYFISLIVWFQGWFLDLFTDISRFFDVFQDNPQRTHWHSHQTLR